MTAKAANSMGSIQRMVNSFVKTQKRMESTAAEATKQRMADALSSFSNSSFIETHADTPVNDGRTQTGKSAVIKVRPRNKDPDMLYLCFKSWGMRNRSK